MTHRRTCSGRRESRSWKTRNGVSTPVAVSGAVASSPSSSSGPVATSLRPSSVLESVRALPNRGRANRDTTPRKVRARRPGSTPSTLDYPSCLRLASLPAWTVRRGQILRGVLVENSDRTTQRTELGPQELGLGRVREEYVRRGHLCAKNFHSAGVSHAPGMAGRTRH